MLFRESRLDELRDEFAELYETLPFWTVAAYKAAERAFRIVESESVGKDPNQNDMTIKPTGSTAFAAIEAAAAAKASGVGNGSAGDIKEIETFFEQNESASDDIREFIVSAINAF